MELPQLISLFSQVGFPAGTAVLLLYFAWHVSRVLLKNHEKFLESIKDSYHRQETILRNMEQVIAGQTQLLEAIHAAMVASQAEREQVSGPRRRTSTG